ncbi:type I restriction endonuclease subunit R [Pseudomonas sp. HLS-6 TE3448]
MTLNQNPEQLARDKIDAQLAVAGWVVQPKKKIDFSASIGVAVREYQTSVGPADYILFIEGKPVGVIEAKPETAGHHITAVESQTEDYANAQLKWIKAKEPLRFLYEATGVITRFTDARDPKPRSREVFSFHRPETLREWLGQSATLRARLQGMPELNPHRLPASALRLRDCQEVAINNLEESFKVDKPRALIQMATGAGKTYTAITAIYRLVKYAGAKRVLFLVDTKNLGEQAEQEMMSYLPIDDSRKFTELYPVQRLKSGYIAKDSLVCVSTIQRMYSILKGEELDDSIDELSPAEQLTQPKQPMPVVYNPAIPPEFFDFIFIDECHRSIYNLWQQVLDYFDASLIGLTATPDNRTYGFFKKNVVSNYDHEKAVADGVNVGNEVYLIETAVTKQGGQLKAEQQVERRERLTRRKRWEQQDEDEAYSNKQLDRDIVNPDQIRTVIRTFRDKLPVIFPGRYEEDGHFQVPKTLIFAKTDSHADDIIQCVREEFGEGNAFCKKVTYRVADGRKDAQGNVIEEGEDPRSVLGQFRNEYNPRIAVTVDMIATGTDVKPLECLLFMRDVKSRNYFEQMKGRGTRTLEKDDLQKVSSAAKTAKTHYTIVDAIGVTKSLKTASQPLITKPSVPFKDLAMGVMLGASDSDTVSSLAGRLARLAKQLEPDEHKKVEAHTGGKPLSHIVARLFNAIDADLVEARALDLAEQPLGSNPGEALRDQAQAELVKEAATSLNGELIELLNSIRREREQVIDHETLDEVLHDGWQADSLEVTRQQADDFSAWLLAHRDELEALTIYFSAPQRRREVTFEQLRSALDALKADHPKLAPLHVWHAYARLEEYKGKHPVSDLTALVALIRRVCGLDDKLTPFEETVARNFKQWIFKRHAGKGEKFNEQQMQWLQMIRDHIASSVHIDTRMLSFAPFDRAGGLGEFYEQFGDAYEAVLDEINEALVA